MLSIKMKKNIQESLITTIGDSLRELKLDTIYRKGLYLDFPTDNRFGDLSTNIALQLSRLLKKSPPEIAKALVDVIEKHLEKGSLRDYVKQVKVEGAGFINFYLNEKYFYEQLRDIVRRGRKALKTDTAEPRRVLVEFVSANPTGPLSVAHARQAAVGDCLANVMEFS